MPEEIKDFLQETKFCNFSDKSIQNLADEIAKNCKDDKEFAVTAFYWVRDDILYRVGDWRRKASETLLEKEGTCTNKANLLVALLRYRKVSAAYGVMKVYGQKYLGPISLPMFKKFIGKISTHIYPLVYLKGEWIKCDPSDDKEFCENTSYFNPTTKMVEWDGVTDAVLNLDKNDIIKEEFPIVNIDPWMAKRVKNARGTPLKVANIYVRFARKNKTRVLSIEELEILFKKYLKKQYPFYFYSFQTLSFLKSVLNK